MEKTGVILSFVLIMALSIVALGVNSFKEQGEKITNPYSIEDVNTSIEDNELRTSVNILMCGIDKAVRLTDVIMLCSYNKEENTISILQIPRDTYVGSLSKTGKINSIYNSFKSHNDGMVALTDVVEEILPVEIDYYGTINLDGFNKIIDHIGGVDIDIPYMIEYLPNQIIYAGEQTLMGEQAQWLIRYREGYATGDIGRLQMQRYFLSQLMRTIKSKNVGEIISIVSECYKYVETDMPFSTILNLAPMAINMRTENLDIASLPGDGIMYYGQAIYAIDKEKAATTINNLFYNGDEYIKAEQIKTPITD